MPKLPNKSIKGANFKKWCIESIDAIIDYLSSARYLQGAPGVTIERKPSGIVIGLEKQAPQTASVSGGTAAYSGLTATVSGGTATVDVSGVNPLELVAGANVNITGGTNGEVIINSSNTPLGFPDYSNPVEPLYFDTSYTYTYPVWIIGTVGYSSSSSTTTVMCGLNFIGSVSHRLFYWSDVNTPTDALEVPVFAPIPANTEFELSTVYLGAPTGVVGSVTAFHCL